MTSTSLFRSIIAYLGEYALASLIVIAFAALRAAGSEPAALTLDDCLRLAADNHPALTAAAAGVSAALITDLLDTQTALASAEASLAQVRWTYLAARAAYERAVGRS